MVAETLRGASELLQELFGCKHHTMNVELGRDGTSYTLSAEHHGIQHQVEIDGSRRTTRGQRGAMLFHALKNAIKADAHRRPFNVEITSEEFEQFAVDEEPTWP